MEYKGCLELIGDGLYQVYMKSEGDNGYKEILDKIIVHNKQAWRARIGLHERINLKSAYHFTNSTSGRYTPNIFHILHCINLEFCTQPYDLFCL